MSNRRPLQILLLICLLLTTSVARLQAKEVILQQKVSVYTDAKAGSPIDIALRALKRDLYQVLGADVTFRPLSAINGSGIVVRNATDTKPAGPAVSGWEAHRVYTAELQNHLQIILEGADERGTIFAIYTFSEKILGVPPLWYFSSWKATRKRQIVVDDKTDINMSSPTVKYRAWFPNDTDLFEPWRKRSNENYELWLETAMRLKLNTIEWFDDERDYEKPYSISKTTKLINDYGLVNTTHHHSPLNASFAGWKDYWRKVRRQEAPELALSNIGQLEEFWRYNIQSIVNNKIDMLWVLGFRGNGDHPFWYSFKDAPASMKERGEIISKMMERQRQILVEVTKNPKPPIRTIFYDELSDLLAKGFIRPPADSSFIWTYVAARRDHFPNIDMQLLDRDKNLRLGYYFNYQFTSTGSHLAAAEGPWKMEQNYRYVASKSRQPIAFSVVNAGNLREHLMELSANAVMMWNIDSYRTDDFLQDYCSTYYGSQQAKKIAQCFREFYNSYWQQRNPDLSGFDRQYVFQDLRYGKAFKDIASAFNKPRTNNPLNDIPAEQVKNRTYNIVPADQNVSTVLEALLKGTAGSSDRFLKVAQESDRIAAQLAKSQRIFFADNLQQRAWYMYHLNKALHELATGYQQSDSHLRKGHVKVAIAELSLARTALGKTDLGIFENWYASDRVFGFKNIMQKLHELL